MTFPYSLRNNGSRDLAGHICWRYTAVYLFLFLQLCIKSENLGDFIGGFGRKCHTLLLENSNVVERCEVQVKLTARGRRLNSIALNFEKVLPPHDHTAEMLTYYRAHSPLNKGQVICIFVISVFLCICVLYLQPNPLCSRASVFVSPLDFIIEPVCSSSCTESTCRDVGQSRCPDVFMIGSWKRFTDPSPVYIQKSLCAINKHRHLLT